MSSRSSGENEIAAAIWGRDRSNWGGLFWNPFLFRGGFLRYELFSIEGFTRTGLIGGGYLIRGQHYTLELQMESANLSSTTDESRVQLMSLEYDEYRLDFRGQRGDLVGKQVSS